MFGIHTRPSLYRDFALLSALIIAILLLVSVWIVFKTYQRHSEDVLQQLESEALRIDRALIIEIERVSYLLESMGRQIDLNAPDREAQLLNLFDDFSQTLTLQDGGFYWIDTQQRIVLSSREGRLERPVDISDRDFMKRAITAPWTIHIGQPVEGRVSKRWVIPIAMGLTDAQDRFVGAISVSLSIKALSQAISQVLKDGAIDFAITNTAFTLLTEMTQQAGFFHRHFSLNELSAIDFGAQPSGVYSTAPLLGGETIYAYYELSSKYPYIIFVGYDAAYSRAEIDDILIPRLVQIGVMTLFLVLTLWTVRSRIIRPVMKLSEHTRAILSGKPFEHDSRGDPMEIEQLADEIRRLSDYIDERRRIDAEMARKNNELLRIREAAEMTSELKAAFFARVGEALMRPARAIGEYVESMHNELFGPLGSEKYQDMTARMQRESETILQTLQDIEAISQAESGLLALNEEPVDLAFIIRKCVRLLRESRHFAHAEVLLDLDDSLPRVMADELRMKQLILNLLSTAAGEIAPHDSLRLSTQYHREGIRIELLYKPDPAAGRRAEGGHKQPAGTATQRAAMPAGAGFMRLGHALSELIIAMHGGEIITRAMPDQMVKKVITLPESRVIKPAAG